MQAASKATNFLPKRKRGKQETQDVKDVDNLKSAAPLDQANGVDHNKSADNV